LQSHPHDAADRGSVSPDNPHIGAVVSHMLAHEPFVWLYVHHQVWHHAEDAQGEQLCQGTSITNILVDFASNSF
jgi:hypothetical protein